MMVITEIVIIVISQWSVGSFFRQLYLDLCEA